jgi:hypothetical protein
LKLNVAASIEAAKRWARKNCSSSIVRFITYLIVSCRIVHKVYVI